MIKIAVCDDEVNSGNALAAQISSCYEKCRADIDIQIYSGSQNLYYEIEDGTVFDMIFLDIDMPVMDGIELTTKIKAILPDIIIVFVTNYEKYVYESFKVQPFRFIPKKYIDTMLDAALIDAYDFYMKNNDKYLVVENQSAVEKVFIRSIKYIWHKDKYAYIEKTNGEQSKVRKTLKDIYKELPEREFIWLDRGCICSIQQISGIHNGDIVLNDGTILQVSKDRLTEIKQLIRKYWLDQGGAE